MKDVTIRRLHEETGRIVEAARAGAVVVISRRGVPVAELRGISADARRAKVPDLNRRYARLPRVKTDSGRILEEDRR